MNKKVGLFALLVIAVMLAASFAMMSSAKAEICTPVYLFATGPPTVFTQIGTAKTLPNGWITETFELAIPNCIVVEAKTPYDIFADSVNTLITLYNPTTGTLYIHFNGNWVVDSKDGFRNPDTLVFTEYNYDPTTGVGASNIVNCVAFGYGRFAGQILVLHYSGPNPETGTWTGYLIMP